MKCRGNNDGVSDAAKQKVPRIKPIVDNSCQRRSPNAAQARPILASITMAALWSRVWVNLKCLLYIRQTASVMITEANSSRSSAT